MKIWLKFCILIKNLPIVFRQEYSIFEGKYSNIRIIFVVWNQSEYEYEYNIREKIFEYSNISNIRYNTALYQLKHVTPGHDRHVKHVMHVSLIFTVN